MKKSNAISNFLENETSLGYLLMAPALLILLIFIAYPFCLGVWLSFTDKLVGKPATFVGLKNFVAILDSQIFRRTIQNTFIFTGAATFFKFILGLALALLLNQTFRFKRLMRASCLLPWIVPTVLSCMAWLWMFDSTYSVFNWLLIKLGIIKWGILWLGDATLAMISIIVVNVWRGTPFFAISFLAGLQTVNPELYEAADIDGAGSPSKLWYITLPMIKPIIIIVMLLSIVWTFADFQVVYALTRGGPYNSTHLFATLAYQIGLDTGALGRGSAVALFMFPILALIVTIQLWYLRRSE